MVDVIDRRGHSTERNATPVTIKEDKGKAVLAVYIAAKDVLPVLHNYQDGAL